MVHLANDRRIMFATGVQKENPPPDEAEIHWIFATSLSEADLQSLASPRKLPETDQVLRLVIACRQEEPKGTDRVLRALALLQEDFPEVRLDVVGGGGHLAASKVLCQSLGLIQSVTFHGAVPREEVLEIFQKSTLFCYPSRASEGFPKVVIEALATGLPFVGSDLGVLEYLALRGGGLTTSSLQPEELAETVAHCLSDPERYAAMSNSALETARCYSLEQWQSTIHNALKPWGPLRSDGAHN
jgi:glycosyltransferase involved in cell wall biosynthesis